MCQLRFDGLILIIFLYLCTMQTITFTLREGDEFIPLIQLLKVLNLVYSGSEAQEVVVAGMVKRNGVVELRKRAKIVAGDIIEFQNTKIVVEA